MWLFCLNITFLRLFQVFLFVCFVVCVYYSLAVAGNLRATSSVS